MTELLYLITLNYTSVPKEVAGGYERVWPRP